MRRRRNVRHPRPLPSCVAKPFTAIQPGLAGTVIARAFQAQAVLATATTGPTRTCSRASQSALATTRDAHRRAKGYAVTFALPLATAEARRRVNRVVQAAGNLVAPGHNGLPMVPGEGEYAPGDLLDPSRLLFGQQGPGRRR